MPRPRPAGTSSARRSSAAREGVAGSGMTHPPRPHAHEMAAQLRAGEITSRELTEAHLAAAEGGNRALNAWLTIDRAGALAQADVADRRLAALAGRDDRDGGAHLRPLLGVPVALKDLVSVKGGQCT